MDERHLIIQTTIQQWKYPDGAQLKQCGDRFAQTKAKINETASVGLLRYHTHIVSGQSVKCLES